ncbi:relaxase/mobilization nuclease domain-containing protein [Phyllobacterium sophorae]|uniref:MobA/VirD2-like nuclease domain-containing protein n=1 Tax=Phyllobacterium sophorae TaxID=1520277 RepID=A0A2P7B2X4_9HYPH|nr:hypothetical protein [Phyllobacterium sophorae]PSH60823.1 hypothetical protein CU103_24960 [Phyllobacterium sophorae]
MTKSPSKLLSRIEAANRALPTYFENIEDKRRSRGGGGGSGSNGGGKRPLGSPAIPSQRAAHNFGVATAVSRAQGNNAVVLKVLSYGAGASSARNVLTYQAKEEKAIDHNGREVADIERAIEDWSREFEGREGSKDILVLSYELNNADREKVNRALERAASEGFHDQGDTERSYAFSTSPGVNDQTRLTLALIIAHEKQSRADKNKVSRLNPTLDSIHKIDRRIDGFLRDEGIEPVSRYQAKTASGRKGLSATLHAMMRGGAAVTISTKTRIKDREDSAGQYERGPVRRSVTTSDRKDLTRESATIASLMYTNQSRDFMHLLISGPAAIDRDRFVKAGAAFLRSQFGTHRYAYAVHNRDDKSKHPHLHVIVALRDSRGNRLHPNIRDFTEWRMRFAEKARERGIQLEPQKRNDRAGPPPIKRWEWELFHRMGAASPATLADKVRAKIHDKSTAPKLEAARARFQDTRKNLNRVIGMLDRLGKDRSASSTARELSQDLLTGLTREYDRLETAIRDGRDPALERGEVHMLRTTPISQSQADIAKERVAKAVIDVATNLNPIDGETFSKAAKVITKLVDLQLDSRIDARIKDRDTQSAAMSTKSAGGKDRVDDREAQPKTSTRKTVDIGRIGQTVQARDHASRDEEREHSSLNRTAEREHQRSNDKTEKSREKVRTIKVRPPQSKDRDRGR